jgi:nucleoside-diphosphate-sugar epimerase
MTRVLLTGASSFTGAWFARALAEAGCAVIAPLRAGLDAGDADRCRRLALAARHARLVAACPFGSERFLALVRDVGPFDLLCHHGAKAGDHRDLALDPLAEAAAHTGGLERVLEALGRAGCRAVLLTGTVFEADEGRGDGELSAIGAYGLAKTLSWQLFRHHAGRAGFTLGKLVLASPVGPLEKPGLSRELASAWLAGKTPVLHRPQLVRDHLQVELLAAAYARFALRLPSLPPGVHRLTPSQFAEPLARFAARLAEALAPRLGVPCRFTCAAPPEASAEPLVRIGLDPLPSLVPELDPEAAWDRHALALLNRLNEAD